MIYFDVTKASGARHRSGLLRVSARVRDALEENAISVVWRGGWKDAAHGRTIVFTEDDWLLTPELFSEPERPGFWAFLHAKPVRLAAIFHDAIPLKFPHFTWPQSVARHPEYIKMLSHFDRVFAVSEASRQELVDFWQLQGVLTTRDKAKLGPVTRIELGSDFLPPASAVPSAKTGSNPPHLLCLGILEPRKNQSFLLDVVASLLSEGVGLALDVVGRTNPHFGSEVEKKLRKLAAKYPQIHYWGPASDETLQALWTTARASVFPTVAEGCGLPLLESLGRGVPCVCSDLPVLRENGAQGGCIFAPLNDHLAWKDTLKRLLTDEAFTEELCAQARARLMPTWAQTAAQLREGLGDRRV